jgi:uncharacterized lipoprotein YddW (UPF0748 family)
MIVFICLILLWGPVFSVRTFADTGEGAVLVLEDGRRFPVGGIDRMTQPEAVTIFTRNTGEFTPAFQGGTLEYIVVRDVIAEKNLNGAHGTYIPSNGYVVRIPKGPVQPLSGLAAGDKVRIENATIPVRPDKYAYVKDVVVKIDKINAATRGQGEVIAYDPSFGPSTKQNAWGMELTIVEGIITRAVIIAADPSRPGQYMKNDSPIPPNGYVLSIQSASPYYKLLAGKAKAGDPLQLELSEPLYRIEQMSYDAYNPKVRADNPPGWNDAGNRPYPGFRGTEQMLVYDRGYGEHTGTNNYGTEIVVSEEGIVIGNGGNNTPIPPAGYVISGHGSKSKWLSDRVPVGTTVIVDKARKRVTAVTAPQSLLNKAKLGIEAAENGLQSSRKRFLDVPYEAIERTITAAKSVYEQVYGQVAAGSYNGLSGLIKPLEQHVNDVTFMNLESRKAETRGVWIRPKETSPEQVREHMLALKEANMNAVYVESWWRGYTIFPTDNEVTTQNPIYEGFDVLQAYIDEGKRLGISVHAWVTNFYGGGPALEKHPDWTIVSRQGETFIRAEGGVAYALNPALPHVRDFVASIYRELLTKYDVASLHLDYIRYPGSGNFTNDFGYDDYTRGLFRSQYGKDPLQLHPGDEGWEDWLQFRTSIINTWVDRVVDEARTTKPGIGITAAVWPTYDTAPALLAQETKTWTDKNQIDHLFHMSYVRDPELLVSDLQKSLDIAGNKAFVVSGIGTYMEFPKWTIVQQVDRVNRDGGFGTAMFEFESFMKGGYGRELKMGVYRHEALVPDYKKTEALTILLSDIIRKIDEIYVPINGAEPKAAAKLKQTLEAAVNISDNLEFMNRGTVTALQNKISKLRYDLINESGLHLEVQNRITADLLYIQKLLDIYFAKLK